MQVLNDSPDTSLADEALTPRGHHKSRRIVDVMEGQADASLILLPVLGDHEGGEQPNRNEVEEDSSGSVGLRCADQECHQELKPDQQAECEPALDLHLLLGLHARVIDPEVRTLKRVLSVGGQ